MVSCTNSTIVGKWYSTNSNDTLEFTSKGDAIFGSDGSIIVGTYKLIGSDVVQVQLEISSFPQTINCEYSISGSTMTFEASGLFANDTLTLKRTKSFTSTSTTTTQFTTATNTPTTIIHSTITTNH